MFVAGAATSLKSRLPQQPGYRQVGRPYIGRVAALHVGRGYGIGHVGRNAQVLYGLAARALGYGGRQVYGFHAQQAVFHLVLLYHAAGAAGALAEDDGPLIGVVMVRPAFHCFITCRWKAVQFLSRS